MASRTRQQTVELLNGITTDRLTQAKTYHTREDDVRVCSDVVGVGNCYPLTISKFKVRNGYVSGETADRPDGRGYILDHVPIGNRGDSSPVRNDLIGGINVNAYATALARMTNPSRPVVDIPVFVAELREVPGLIKLAGDTLLKKAASANLTYWFGIAPLLSDLKSLCNFGDIAAKRYDELKRFYSSGLSCTRDLDRLSSNAAFEINASPTGYNCTLSCNKAQQRRIWGHIKWFPTTPGPRTDREMLALAKKAALGLTVDLATAWELMPWSWLADWCGTVGDYLIAKRNIIPARHDDLIIMAHDRIFVSSSIKTESFPWGQKSLSCSPPSYEIEYKRRYGGTVSITADLPWLTLRQISILGSLFVLRNKARLLSGGD